MSRGRVLIVDDDTLFAEAVSLHLGRDEIEVATAASLAEAQQALGHARYDLMLLDYTLPDGTGMELVDSLADADRVPAIVISARSGLQDALAARGAGIREYLVKPIELEELRLAVLSTLDARGRERRELAARRSQAVLTAKATEPRRAFGPAYTKALETAETAAKSPLPLLLIGETGTGKTTLARRVHELGGGERPLVEVNCGAIPANLIEAELFGTEPGAFTGARAKPGLIELADGGTLFLDEVAELPLSLQPKLLAVVEDSRLRRVGGTRERRVETRIIAATHVDLERAVQERRFRADLRFRLDVLRVEVPALRERFEDLGALVDELLARIDPTRPKRLGPGELARLRDHDWPGNLRELRNILERAHLSGMDQVELSPSAHLNATGRADVSAPAGDFELKTMAEVERDHILGSLRALDGRRDRTAAALGLSPATLRRRLREYGERSK